MNKEKILTSKRIIVQLLLSFVIAFSFAAGKVLDTTDTFDVKSISFWTKFVIISCVSFATLTAIAFIPQKDSEETSPKQIPKLAYIIPTITWLATWLACFPGVFSYDSYEEWQMISSGNLTSHHPVLHVLILGGLTELSNKIFNTGNAGIAVYVGLQLIFGMFVVKQLVDFLSATYKKQIYQWIAIIFFSFSPVILLFTTATTKDSIFGFFELWFIINIITIVEEKTLNKKRSIDLILSSLGTMIFRKNGLYIVIVALIVLVIVSKNFRKQTLTCLAIIAAIYAIYVGPVYKLLNVQKSSSAEMLSVPLQQMARVYRFDYDDLTEEQIENMYKYVPQEYWEDYIPTTADAVKMGFNQESFDTDKATFFKTWLELGLSHPQTYINAFLVNTVDLWYPQALNDGYRWLYGLDESKSNFFDYKVAEPGKETVLIKPLNQFFEYISEDKTITTRFIPSIFLNPGWYILLWLCTLASSIIYKKRNHVLFHIIMALSLLTVLAGPMSMIRYVLIFYMVTPIEIAMILTARKADEIIIQ